ncbi:hypothetical protein HGA92_04730 [Candidatus Gracilibacteria bacterium]|nr:hypothetical protein [Candidatus Gracilibacteria bacterium]NUJ98460.1 hypothetical protein [Candidatus Gracilibacteria bacterium]
MALEEEKHGEQPEISGEQLEILEILKEAGITTPEKVIELLEIRKRIVNQNLDEKRLYERLVIAGGDNGINCS